MRTFLNLKQSVEKKGAGFIVLIDPDKKNDEKVIELVENANLNGADAIFVGGSIMMDSFYNERVKKIKSVSNIPVILFPGGVNQISKYFDAILFIWETLATDVPPNFITTILKFLLSFPNINY